MIITIAVIRPGQWDTFEQVSFLTGGNRKENKKQNWKSPSPRISYILRGWWCRVVLQFHFETIFLFSLFKTNDEITTHKKKDKNIESIFPKKKLSAESMFSLTWLPPCTLLVIIQVKYITELLELPLLHWIGYYMAKVHIHGTTHMINSYPILFFHCYALCPSSFPTHLCDHHDHRPSLHNQKSRWTILLHITSPLEKGSPTHEQRSILDIYILL